MIKITDKIVSWFPKKEFNNGPEEKFINWVGKHVSTPENRIVIGVTALLTQPFIDYFNKDVDKKTQEVSCARTIAKNVAGMTSGYLVREGFIKLIQKCSELGDTGKKIQKLFTPSNAPKANTFAYKQYQNAMGMVFAIVGLCFTNFLFDAPVTNYLTNKITKFMESQDAKKGEKNEK